MWKQGLVHTFLISWLQSNNATCHHDIVCWISTSCYWSWKPHGHFPTQDSSHLPGKQWVKNEVWKPECAQHVAWRQYNLRTYQILVLQDETLVLCALESEGHRDVVSQTETCQVSWERAPRAELGLTNNLDKEYMGQRARATFSWGTAINYWGVLPRNQSGSLCWCPLAH